MTVFLLFLYPIQVCQFLVKLVESIATAFTVTLWPQSYQFKQIQTLSMLVEYGSDIHKQMKLCRNSGGWVSLIILTTPCYDILKV